MYSKDFMKSIHLLTQQKIRALVFTDGSYIQLNPEPIF